MSHIFPKLNYTGSKYGRSFLFIFKMIYSFSKGDTFVTHPSMARMSASDVVRLYLYASTELLASPSLLWIIPNKRATYRSELMPVLRSCFSLWLWESLSRLASCLSRAWHSAINFGILIMLSANLDLGLYWIYGILRWNESKSLFSRRYSKWRSYLGLSNKSLVLWLFTISSSYS